MGVDYKWGGSAGGIRFGQEIERLAKVFGGVKEGSVYKFPTETDRTILKFFGCPYGPLDRDEVKRVWKEFQEHPEIEQIMPDMWNEFKCDALYDEWFKLSY